MKQEFQKNGYLQYKAQDADDYCKNIIFDEFKKLEKDEFSDENNQRFRRYGNAIIYPWDTSKNVTWLPTKITPDGNELSGYDQGSNNPEHDSIRYFNALSSDVKNTAYLNRLIMDDYDLTFGFESYHLPIYVGVHFVKLISNNINELGVSSPNCFHQDGEPFTFAHLIYRSENVEGGVNYIACSSQRNIELENVDYNKVHHEFTMKNFGDSFIVQDSRVSHYVSPIRKRDENFSSAERWMILIDYSFTKQKI